MARSLESLLSYRRQRKNTFTRPAHNNYTNRSLPSTLEINNNLSNTTTNKPRRRKNTRHRSPANN